MSNPMSYEGKRVVLTGAASGIGAALTDLLGELGASEIVALDMRQPTGPVTTHIECDMGDPASIDAAVAQITGPVHVLFNNAGVAATSTPARVMQVNLLGLVRATESLAALIPSGGAVVNTASIAGMNWPEHLAEIQELLAIEDWTKAVTWIDQHPELVGDGYSFSKECVQVTTMQLAKRLIGAGVRIASVCPGAVDTPLLVEFKQTMGEALVDWSAAQGTGEYATPHQVASVLAFLGSDAASHVSGVNLNIDAGFQAGLVTGQIDLSDAPLA